MTTNNELAISVKNVSKDFKLPHEKVSSIKGLFTSAGRNTYKAKPTETQHALKDITFDIKKGEFFGIVGRNGSGKSTLLKILAGIYQPTKGSVKVSGRLVPFIELGVGFNTELSGRDNVFLNGSLLGFSTKEIEEKYDDIVGFAELERFMDQKLKNYSSGMQVRLAFSVATILAQSDILLIDEVLAVGDASFQRKCFEYFSSLKKQKKTVVFVSHDMSAVREYCDRALLIDDSKIVEIGKSIDIATLYTRLFNTESGESVGNKKVRIWGDKGVVFEEISISSKSLEVGHKDIEVTTRIKANVDVINPIVGFMIKNASGDPLMGTNTKIEKQPIRMLKKNQSFIISWKIPNIFSDGTYSSDLAITHSDGVGVFEWREDAIKFDVRRELHLPYSIAPEFELTVKEVSE